MAVNVSARNLARPDFADNILAALERTCVAPERLVLEITETALPAGRLPGWLAAHQVAAPAGD